MSCLFGHKFMDTAMPLADEYWGMVHSLQMSNIGVLTALWLVLLQYFNNWW